MKEARVAASIRNTEKCQAQKGATRRLCRARPPHAPRGDAARLVGLSRATLYRHQQNTRAPSKHAAAWLGEVIVHSQDIRRPLGLQRTPATHGVTAVAEFFAARNFAVPSHSAAKGLRLEATDGPFRCGSDPMVSGITLALTIAMAGRETYCDDLTGSGVSTMRSRCTG